MQPRTLLLCCHCYAFHHVTALMILQFYDYTRVYGFLFLHPADNTFHPSPFSTLATCIYSCFRWVLVHASLPHAPITSPYVKKNNEIYWIFLVVSTTYLQVCPMLGFFFITFLPAVVKEKFFALWDTSFFCSGTAGRTYCHVKKNHFI